MMAVAVLAIGVLVGVGAWLLLDDDLVQVALGALLLGHGAVLLLVAPRPSGEAPLLPSGGAVPPGLANPLPQALALTAIVIAFGVTILLLSLAGRSADDWVADRDDATDPTEPAELLDADEAVDEQEIAAREAGHPDDLDPGSGDRTAEEVGGR